MIFTYFERLKPELRQEILKVQSPPETFSEYVTFVKNIENSLAAARLDRPGTSVYTPPKTRSADQIPPQQIPPHLQVVAMDIDGTRRQVLKLQPTESARRREGNLCHYCGLQDYVLVNCPNKSTSRTVRFLDLQPQEPKNDPFKLLSD